MTQQIAIVEEVRQGLAKEFKSLSNLLPNKVEKQAFFTMCISAVENAYDIEDCNVDSVIRSCKKAAGDGLMLDNKEAALVTFNKKVNNKWEKHAQYMPMVKGIIKAVITSGKVAKIEAFVVYMNDSFSYKLGLNPDLIHVPNIDNARGEMRCAYAIATLTNGEKQFEVMTKDEIRQINMASKSGWDSSKNEPKGVWKSWESEMWRKTAIKRLAKFLPSSTILDRVMDNDNEDYGDLPPAQKAPTVVNNSHTEANVGSQGTKASAAILGSQEEAVDGEIVEEEPPMNDGSDIQMNDPI